MSDNCNERLKYQPLIEKKRQILLDTDIGPDCDDAGAISVLIYYAQKYGLDIAGVANCTSNPAGRGVIDAIFNYYGYPTPPLGQFSGKGFMDGIFHRKYNDAVADYFSKAYREGTLPYEDEVTYYRRRLAAAEDKGVTVVTIGMFNNLAALLRSGPDAISDLDGRALFEKKVYAVVSMATNLPQGRECNVVEDYVSARYFFENCPVPMFLSDFFIGVSVRSGAAPGPGNRNLDRNPVAAAYFLYVRGDCRNSSFDLTAVQFAVLGEGELYGLTEPGRVEFWEEIPGLCDSTRFVPDPNGNVRYMTKRAGDDELGRIFDEILNRA